MPGPADGRPSGQAIGASRAYSITNQLMLTEGEPKIIVTSAMR